MSIDMPIYFETDYSLHHEPKTYRILVGCKGVYVTQDYEKACMFHAELLLRKNVVETLEENR